MIGPSDREGGRVAAAAPSEQSDAARKRAAVETYARHEATLRRQARRYSICDDDAEDALQRGLEILLCKAPTTNPRELIKWTQTVVKHEALAIRRERERILAGPAARQPDPDAEDWVALIPAGGDGPPERVARREAVARSREALQALKPQELRALTLLAEGYSYREIGEITGYSATKINRCLAEGRERFRRFLARSEAGGLCAELQPLLSLYCDGEASAEQARAVGEHLRVCAHCRAALRTYRAAPGAAAALAPTLPLSRPLLDRAHDAVTGLAARFGGGGTATDSALSQVAAAGGTRGAGMAALAKVLAVCVGTVGGAAACVATGVVPTPALVAEEDPKPPAEEQPAADLNTEAQAEAPEVEYEASPEASDPPSHEKTPREEHTATATPTVPSSSAGAVEYTPPPEPTTFESGSSSSAASAASAAPGEFGP